MSEETAVEQPTDSTAPTETPVSESSEQLSEGSSESEASTQESASDEDLLVTKEELAEIKKNPALNKLYRSLNKGWTQKTQTLAEERRSSQQALQLVEALRTNPQATLQELARFAGVEVSKPKEQTQAQVDALNQLFGPDLGPQIATAVKTLVDQETSGIRQVAEQTAEQSRIASATAVLTAFEEAHPDLKTEIGLNSKGEPITIQSRMRELSAEWAPAQQMDPTRYLDRLYKMAKQDLESKQTEAQVARKLTDRINQSARASESPSGAAPPKQVAHSYPTGKGALRAAFAMAMRGERATD